MDLLRIAGILLAGISFVFLLIARMQLGKSFAVGTVAKDLVTHGLYSRIRNPMYVFVDLTILGFAMAIERWWISGPMVAALALVLIPFQIWKSGKEAAALREKFGERMTRTGKVRGSERTKRELPGTLRIRP